ncbi:MAG: hypothetical protein QM572_03940 [Nocardioides sp.]|uniref:hypothetical protein n=1 Tax=Nocardioides sp. TaxID=35761 RepID=UPI0039E3BF43
MADEDGGTQWFVPNNSRISGFLGAAVAAVVVVVATVQTDPVWIAAGLLLGMVVWLVLLRPRVGLRGRTLVLRGVASTVEIPLSLLTSSAVRQVFVAWVGEQRYVNASLGRPARDVRVKRGREVKADPYLDHVQALIASHRDDALRWGDEGGGVRRRWARGELTVLAALVVAVVLLIAV